MDRSTKQNVEHDAEILAIQALTFLAGQPEELDRFLGLTGIDPDDLRRLAGDPALLGGVLDFLLQDEALLLVFCEENALAPEVIGKARRRLDGDSPEKI